MGAMRKGERGIDGLGPIGIALESLKVFRAHAKVFVLIQLALMLHLAIAMVTFQYFLYKKAEELQPGPSPDPGPETAWFGSRHVSRLPGHFEMSVYGDSVGWPMVQLLLVFVIMWAGLTVFQAALSLSHTTTIYAVGLHYAGQAVSFIDVVRAATPRLWARLALTNTYACLIYLSVGIVETVGILLLLPISYLVSEAFVFLLLVGTFFAQTIFAVAAAVSVLDDEYGWASIAKSQQLLKEKMRVALLFQLLCFLPGFVNYGVQNALRSQIGKDEYSPLALTLLFLSVVAYLGLTTFIWQINAVSKAVQYVSFKAYHDESLAASFHEKGTTKEGYEHLIEDGSMKAALLTA